MQLSNFSIGADTISIAYGDLLLDLHNFFDFQSFEYDVKARHLSLHWRRRASDSVPEDYPATLELSISGVSLFKARERNSEIPFSEDDCLASMGFLHEDLLEEMDSIATGTPGESCSHFCLHFMSGLSLKIAGDEATLRIDP